MVTVKIISISLLCIITQNVNALSFPGPRVYVVTPSPRPFQVNNDNSAPFYYHNWIRRMDSDVNSTTTMTPKTKTPDLIFAEFESGGGMKKSIRKLLENERISLSTSTTSQPIYVPDEDDKKVTRIVNYGLPVSTNNDSDDESNAESDMTYFSMNKPDTSGPVYLPSTNKPMTTTSTSTTTTASSMNVENIWHIIENEKLNQHSGNWDEVSIDSSDDEAVKNYVPDNHNDLNVQDSNHNDDKEEGEPTLDGNFALPGFSTNAGSGAENESRAIRTEPNYRFPYINLKPFQMKNLKKPLLDVLSNSKKGNNMYTNLDNFYDLKDPVRGEAQEVGAVSTKQTMGNNQPIDRYNPAQPYLPQAYGKASKQGSSMYSPPKATANLVPPPPPPPSTGNDFPAPSSYESFPPYPPSGPSFPAPMPPSKIPASLPAPAPPSPSLDSPPPDSPVDSYSAPGDDGPPMDMGYRYKAPSPPQFLPTIAPVSKPFKGYSYDKPITPDNDEPMSMPDFQGYHYSKPSSAPEVHDHPEEDHHGPPSYDSAPTGPSYGHGIADKPPEHHETDYPDLIFDHHGHMGDSHGGDMKGPSGGMMPPPDVKPQTYGAPPDDHGFPSDFPGDLKFHHDFHEHEHYHDHPPPTTTETPRVNRFSYYYLGKKLYYLPLYFSVYFIVYVGALIIKAVLRHKIVYPNSWRPNTTTASFFSKRSVDELLSNENLHEMTGRVTRAIATAANKYMNQKDKLE